MKERKRLLLEGHGLLSYDRTYVRQDVNLLKEYQKGIDNLTIDPANRLQRTVEVLKIEKSRNDKLEAKIQKCATVNFICVFCIHIYCNLLLFCEMLVLRLGF